MRFGSIGSGMVGQTLAADPARLGHEVVVGTRDPGKLETFAREHPGVRAALSAEAAAFGEMVLLATRWEGTRQALELADAENLSGKVVVDITHPLDFSGGRGGAGLASGGVGAGALNTVRADAMLKPREFNGGERNIFIAGNDAGAEG